MSDGSRGWARAGLLVPWGLGSLTLGCQHSAPHVTPLAPRGPEAEVLVVGDFAAGAGLGGAGLGGWNREEFSGVAPTDYRLVREGGDGFLRGEADAGAAMFVRAVDVDPAAWPRLSWRWRAQALPAGADLRQKTGDDAAARLYVSFAYEPERASIGDRLARALSRRELPGSALCYVWAGSLEVGTALPNTFAEQVHMIVVDSGARRLRSWRSHERDLVEDYRRVFGRDPPRIVAVSLMVDADQTAGRAAADFDDLVLLKR